MKKYLIKILYALVGAIIFGIGGFLKFISYGANDCDNPGKICDCFCCNSFGLRGYEACGNYGLYLGAGIGLVLGYVFYLFVKRMTKLKK
ncbi:MAG: hypothetical protein WCJ57_04410 [Candidatus Falkowbacteria bacterium]